jgi:nicotinate-nucleotide adenylyltransferase
MGERVIPSPRPVVTGSIGILGGTFDPIHVAHLAVAEEAREVLGLERILFVPAGLPPHKPGRPISPAHHRVAMAQAAIADNPAFAISRIEVDRLGPSYAVDTLEALAAEERASGREPDLTFILSVEAFRELPSWREPRRLLALCRMAVVPRGGARAPGRAWLAEHLPGQEDRIAFLDGPQIRLSASQVRERVAAGRSIRYLVPPPVAAYIAEHHLYESDSWRKNRP